MKKKLKKLIIILGIILIFVAIWFGTVLLQKPPMYPTAQMDIDKYYDEYLMNYSVTKEDLIKDVDSLVKYTEELHADPFRVITKKAFLEKAEEVKSKINAVEFEGIPAIDAFYYIQELATFIEDGHTTIYPLNWEKTVESIFPLIFTSIDGRIFVKDNYGVNDVPMRVEILAINDVSIKQMVVDAMKYMPGTLQHLKQARFAEQLSLIIQTYYKMSSPWKITYKQNGIIKVTTIQGISLEYFKNASTPKKDYIESEIIVNGKTVPILEFVGFGNGEWDVFKAFIDDLFIRYINKEYLIIDVRHNPGGNGDWGYYVLSYLINFTLQGLKEFSFKVSSIHQDIIQYMIQNTYYEMKIPKFLWRIPFYKFVEQDDPYYWIGRGILESKPCTLYYAKNENNKSYLADELFERFHGKVFLLTSHETFSAGVVFTGLFKSNNLGTIVGSETGGRVYMSSDMRPVFLPNSNFMYLIPVAKLIVSDENPDRGVIPDFNVDLTTEDYINYRDKDIEKVIELIKADIAKENPKSQNSVHR